LKASIEQFTSGLAVDRDRYAQFSADAHAVYNRTLEPLDISSIENIKTREATHSFELYRTIMYVAAEGGINTNWVLLLTSQNPENSRFNFEQETSSIFSLQRILPKSTRQVQIIRAVFIILCNQKGHLLFLLNVM
jgi:hypothetical protein